RDKTVALDQPFTGEPTPLVLVEHRFVGFAWLPARDQVLLTEFDRDRRWRRTAQMDLTRPEQSRRALLDLSVDDAYNNPGSPLTITRPDGVTTILQDGDSIYLAGAGAAPEGARPFLDKMNIKTREKTRLFRCQTETFESPISLVGNSRSKILISHETKREPPNYFI